MPEPDHDHQRLRAAALALFVTFLWSTSWVLIRAGLDDEDLAPLTFAGLRYALAALVLAGYLVGTPRRRAQRRLDQRDWLLLAALGVVFYAVTQGAQFVAIDAQPVATTNVLLAMTPLVVALSSAALLGEHTTAVQRAGAVVIVAGAVVYFAGDLGATAVGLAAATIALVANAAASLLGRSINRTMTISPIVVTTVSMSVGAAILLVAGLSLDGVPHLSGRGALIVAWLAVVNTAAAFTWWNHAHRHLSAAELAAINTTMAVQIPILGWIFLDEPLGAPEVAGITLVVTGVLAMQTLRRPPPASPTTAPTEP